MTDLKKFVELYRSLVIECNVIYKKNGFEINLNGSDAKDQSTESEKFDGYMGFFSTIYFNLDGKFIKQGFWE